jgi:hypothetical protein
VHKKFRTWSMLMAGALLAALAVALPAEASGGPGGTGGTGAGGAAARTTTAVATTTVSASLSGSLAFPTAGGSINVVRQPRVALSGDITNTGLPTGTVVDLLINGTYIQSEPILAAASQIAPGGGTVFTVERLPGNTANLTAPLLTFLSTVNPGSTVVVRETTLRQPPGFIAPVPVSPDPGAVIATGTFR